MTPLSVYIHVPFCARKCAYCDFNAYSGLGSLTDAFTAALIREIATSDQRGRAAHTVFFGGGTPTYLCAEQLEAILAAVRDTFDVAPDAEITSEANPTSADSERFRAMREAGFNRLSIGVQAFDDRLLKAVDRDHSADEAEAAVRAAFAAGFGNLSVDLMFGLPGQTRADWTRSLDRAVALGVTHISAYSLTIEAGTRFERLHAGGKLALPDEDDDLWMFEHAIERLSAAGFEHYEVSNYARPGFRARHNLTYWRNEEYAGFGPGAVSYIGGRRWTTEKNPSRYIRKVTEGEDLAVESERLPLEGALAETLMMGLRLREGVVLGPLAERFGVDPRERYAAQLDRLRRRGWLEGKGDRIRLTHAGLLMANDVSAEFLP
jgi:oxygen-independent coproporphyrinogen-3 oxidase